MAGTLSDGGVMAKRVGISKGTRFRIFTRDNFACRYCGQQSDTVVLVVDHVIPVASGGTNDDANLVTACEPCNQGKGARDLTSSPVDYELIRLRLAQEMQEQQRAADSARLMVEANAEFRQVMVDVWCAARGTTDVSKQTVDIMTGFARKYGPEMVAGWIMMVAERFRGRSDYGMGQYICGIRRNLINDGTITADGLLVPAAAAAPIAEPRADEDDGYPFDDREEDYCDSGSDMMVDPAFYHAEAFIE